MAGSGRLVVSSAQIASGLSSVVVRTAALGPADEGDSVFKRKRGSQQDVDAEELVEVAEVDEAIEEGESGEVGRLGQSPGDFPVGPYDIEDVPDNGVVRIDLGGIQIAGFTDMQIQLEPDEQGGRIGSVLAIYNDAAIRMQPYAAPRKGGLWEEMRPNIVEAITSAGGDVDEVEGSLGTELHAVVPAVDPEGNQVRQPVRLVGVEGPRWVLHGVFMGAAAVDESAAEVFEDVFRQTVVVRGAQPMAPGDLLPIVIPEDATAEPPPTAEADERPPLDPFERGPEITEIR